jgi:tetratricopeptide (TPR) repeat protein
MPPFCDHFRRQPFGDVAENRIQLIGRRCVVKLDHIRSLGQNQAPGEGYIMNDRKTCFVVQGYGEKTDFTDGRKLNLDASYQVIKEAVEEAGLNCLRSDEVVRSGMIDIPMYEWILKADLVIADLSTYNVNAAYELGVRYGVAPSATIIVAEDKFKNPFDFTHIVLHTYEHLGKDIGLTEARRFKAYLSGVIRDVMAGRKADSPIYEFFDLNPPGRRAATTAAVAPSPTATPAGIPQDTAKGLVDRARKEIDRAREEMGERRFSVAKELLQMVHRELLPNDPYVLQQLAFATYRSKDPDEVTALRDASHILREKLQADTTNDPETLGLYGAVHKRLWNLGRDRKNLDTAITAYERGFYLKRDYYNGIHVAFLFNVRAVEHQTAGHIAEAIADFVLARRIRREVISICEQALAARPRTPERESVPGRQDRLTEDYWILATLSEAAYGLEDPVAAAKWRHEAEEAATDTWMLESTRPQLEELEKLLAASPLKQLSLPLSQSDG